MAKVRKPRTARVPIFGKAEHNAGFLLAIGNLVVNWSNNEGVFLAMMGALLQNNRAAAIIWHSHRSSHAKLELVHRLCRERITDEGLLSDIGTAISRFKGFSRTRNFYCHALYNYDSELNLMAASSTKSPVEGDPLALETRRLDLSALNEINNASLGLATFNRELWMLTKRVGDAMGGGAVEIPEFFAE